MEKTFVMVKPDGVQRGKVGLIIARLEDKGLQLIGLKLAESPSDEKLASHYQELVDRPFYPDLVRYMQSGGTPLVCTAWQGPQAVTVGRQVVGATDPTQAAMGTVRGDWGVVRGANLVHASDSGESAEREINIWFGRGSDQEPDLVDTWDMDSLNNWTSGCQTSE